MWGDMTRKRSPIDDLFRQADAQHSAERKIIFYGLILAFWFKAVVFQRFDDLRDVLMAVGLGGDFEHDTVETILGLELVVIEPDDVGALIGEDLCDQEQLTRCIRQFNAEGENASAGDETGADHRGDGDHVDVATGDDAANFFIAAVEMA